MNTVKGPRVDTQHEKAQTRSRARAHSIVTNQGAGNATHATLIPTVFDPKVHGQGPHTAAFFTAARAA